MSSNKEHLELFEGRKDYFDILSTVINEKCAQIAVCTHENKEVFEDGSGYCIDCGFSFDNVDQKPDLDENGICKHNNKYENDTGMFICRDCNQEFEGLGFDQEWKSYSDGPSAGRDLSRCHKNKQPSKSIEKTFQDRGCDVSPAIRSKVELKYNTIVESSTIRGQRRLAIIAVCLFFTYIEFKQHKPSDVIKDIFGLPKKKMSEGFVAYYKVFKESRTIKITPTDLIPHIISLAGIDEKRRPVIEYICKAVEKSSILFARSSPQSVASAVTYYYLCLNPEYKEELGLTKTKFVEVVGLSDITVTKILKEAELISKCMAFEVVKGRGAA